MFYIIKDFQHAKISLINELLIEPSNTVLFINDAVLYFQHAIKTLNAEIFALRDSVLLIGIASQIPQKVTLIGYPQWVELTEKHQKVITL